MIEGGKAGHDAALARGAHEMDFTGRPMRGMVIVAGSDVRDNSKLDPWVRLAVEFAQSEPPKASKKA